MHNDSGTVACLSIRQPWADLIAAGIKPIENRGWRCAYRGPLLIHAGKTWGREEETSWYELKQIAIDMDDLRRQHILDGARERLGGFVGMCTMRQCVHERQWFADGGMDYDGEHNWFIGPYGYVLTGAKFFRTVIPYRGQQGLFLVPRHAVPGLY